jgi:hypothetical protein
MLSGWAIVAAVLRKQLLDHAIDCDCGSTEWLQRMSLHDANG